MINISIADHIYFLAFWLAFSRWVAILFQLPLFDNVGIPGPVKVLGSLVITYALFPYSKNILMAEIQHVGVSNVWLLLIFHLAVGLVIGLLVKAIMNIFIAAGMVITQQIGFGAMRYFDPNIVQQIGPFEKLLQISMVILVISSGALVPMIKGGQASFETISYFQMARMEQTPAYFTNLFKEIFLSSILLASPMLFTNMMVTMVMGIIARTVPQMNVLMVSFVVNIGLGLIAFMMISDEFFVVAFKLYTKYLGNWFKFIT